ncbi:MAG: EF-hand domain-containing protein [Sphingomicrobium sp.]
MSKYLLVGAAAVAMIAVAPAVAQTVQPAPAPQVMMHHAPGGKAHTRADVGTHVRTMFERLDSNRDGFVTKAETAAVRAAHAGKRGDRLAKRAAGARNPGAMFERLDSNRDGAISRAEFDAHHAQRQQRVAARDTNGDGRPDVGRMRGGNRMGGLGGRMFDMADGNRDGRVTLQEATAAAYRHFDMADVNRDGQITREERMQMHQKMRTERRPG